MAREWLKVRHEELVKEAQRLAGSLTNLAQRATVYRHLFLASHGNHTFPLIAAHGALWAGGYFRWGLRLGEMFSYQYWGRPAQRNLQLERLHAFADTFRDINRRVCIDTYVNFYFTLEFGDQPEVEQFVPRELLEPLNRLHAARLAQREMNSQEKQTLFTAHFLHEQKNVVGPTLTEAVAKFDWPLVRAIALKPIVRFAYFPTGTRLWFHDFSHQEERIAKGLTAFQIGDRVGWTQVDAALQKYRLLPNAFFTEPARYFDEMREEVMAMT